MKHQLSKLEICSFCGDVVPLYLQNAGAAAVEWSCSGNAVRLHSFADDALSPFSYGVLLALDRVGSAEVVATCEGERYVCRVQVRERRTADPTGELQYFRGDLHTHTASTHTPEKYAAQPRIQQSCVQQLANDKRLDFGILSDHASVMRRRGFFEGFVEEELEGAADTVIFPGSESEVTVIEMDRFGLPHKHSGEIVVLNAANSSSVKSWQEFYDDMSDSPLPVAIFAHPFVLGVGQNSLWSFPYDRLRTPEMYRLMRGIEMGSGSQNGGSLLFEYAYAAALDNGFRVSPVCSSDCHGPQWGFDVMNGKTVIMAQEKGREAFVDALRSNRFYACESANVKLHYTVNGIAAPTDLPLAGRYDFHVELSYFEKDDSTRPVCCQVISDGGETLCELKDLGDVLDFTIPSDTARYFYLRLLDKQGRKTWSCPVWTGREFDAPLQMGSYVPLDKAKFTAVDEQSGADAAAVLDNDPGVEYVAKTPTVSILIDMGEAREISAVGYYVRRFTKDWIKETSQDWKAEIGGRMLEIIKRYVAQYAISTSVDGVQYTPVASGAIRAFGDEEILAFPTHVARFVRFEALSTVGEQSGIPSLRGTCPSFGELSVFVSK